MKKYLTGAIALALATITLAFTEVPKLKTNLNAPQDACTQASKKWYKINVGCLGQTSVDIVRNASNYTLSSTQETSELCQGMECVCAILACPVSGNPGRPNIGTTTTIYTNLYSFYYFGQPAGDIVLKDQQSQRQAP